MSIDDAIYTISGQDFRLGRMPIIPAILIDFSLWILAFVKRDPRLIRSCRQ